MSQKMEELSNRSKIIYTISLNVSYFIYGIGSNMLGLTLIDMANLLNVTLSQVSIGLSVKSFFFSIGSLICILSLNKFNRQFQLALSFMFLGISLTLIPISKDINQYYLWEAVAGICSAAIEISCNVWMLEIWGKEENHRHMQSLYFFLSLGNILAPIITVPFLSSEDRVLKDVPQNLSQNLSDHQFVKSKVSSKYLDIILSNSEDNLTAFSLMDHHSSIKSQIHIPYAIIGFIIFVAGLIINLLYLFVPYDVTCKRKDDNFILPKAKTKESKLSLSNVYYWAILILCCTISCFYFAITMNNNGYIQAFAVESQLTTKTTGSYLTLVYSCVLTFSCFCFVFISTKLSPKFIIFIDLILMIIANFILIYFCHSIKMLWLSIVLLGIGMSSIYPSLYSLMKQKIDVNNNVGSVIIFFSGIISIFYQLLEGNYIETYPLTFPLINLVSLIIMVVLFSLLFLFDLIYNSRLNKQKFSLQKLQDDIDFMQQEVNKNSPL